MAEYRLAPKARDDLEAVWMFSLNQWGPEQTGRYIDGLTDAFEFLAENFASGVPCNHIRKGYRRFSLKRHMIYYRKTPYGIEVMRVLHDRMLPLRHF